MTFEAIRLNTTGVSKEATSKINVSDLQHLGVSKEMTLAETQSIPSIDKDEVGVTHHLKPRTLLH